MSVSRVAQQGDVSGPQFESWFGPGGSCLTLLAYFLTYKTGLIMVLIISYGFCENYAQVCVSLALWCTEYTETELVSIRVEGEKRLN